jgi:hypothetical protein
MGSPNHSSDLLGGLSLFHRTHIEQVALAGPRGGTNLAKTGFLGKRLKHKEMSVNFAEGNGDRMDVKEGIAIQIDRDRSFGLSERIEARDF